MSPSDSSFLVEKFPHCSAAERGQLLDFARTTPLRYGAWKPFKRLFKQAEAELPHHADLELMGALLLRIDEIAFTHSSARWKAVEATQASGKTQSVTGNGFTYTVGGRNRPWGDYTGWRLIVHSSAAQPGVLAALRRALGLTAQGETTTPETIAFDFDARSYIYEVKSVALADGELKIVCGSSYRWGSNRETTFVVDVSDPNFIHLRDDGPKTPTLQYMKRRARRVLRHLSQQNPALYVQLATQLLREHGAKPLDPALNWAAMDVLFAHSPRWQQPQAGRGPYQKTPGKLVLKRREERAPEVWNAHLDDARELLAHRAVPLEANELALKMLRAQGEDCTSRTLERAQLERFLGSALPLLQHLATRQFAQLWQSGEHLTGATWARLVLLADARTRRTLSAAQLPLSDAAWSQQAARAFSEALEQGAVTKKRRAAHLLVERFAERISDDVLWRNLETFADVSADTRAWMLSRVRQSARSSEFWRHSPLARLSQMARLRPDLREMLMRALSEEAATLAPAIEQAIPLVAGNDQEVNALGWQLLAATAISHEATRRLWHNVWSSKAPFTSAMHETAAQSAAALQLFERADFSTAEIETWLPKAPLFFERLAPPFFAAVFRRVSPSTQVERALAANDDQWRAARAVLLQTLGNPALLGTFWIGVLERMATSADEALSRRILDDEQIAATFERMPKEAVAALFAHTPVAHESYLMRWLDANASQLERGDAALLAAATHPFGAIRERGLARVREVGLDLPLALRLMESGLPQPFDLARVWFETNDGVALADRALALCDSPDARVRSFGREFLEAQGEKILDVGLLRKLAETDDPIMQAWLAEHLLRDAQGAAVTAFDRAVLRARGRARRAKEAVKKRRDVTKATAPVQHADEDIAALLDVARGRTTRDREWALQQLAQVALSGREIEGVHVQRADAAPDEASNGAGGQ